MSERRGEPHAISDKLHANQPPAPSEGLSEREALAQAAWQFDFIAKQMERDPVLSCLAPSLREAANDARAALSSPVQGGSGSASLSVGENVGSETLVRRAYQTWVADYNGTIIPPAWFDLNSAAQRLYIHIFEQGRALSAALSPTNPAEVHEPTLPAQSVGLDFCEHCGTSGWGSDHAVDCPNNPHPGHGTGTMAEVRPAQGVGVSEAWRPTPEAETEAVIYLREWLDRRFYKLIRHHTARILIGSLVAVLSGRCNAKGDALTGVGLGACTSVPESSLRCAPDSSAPSAEER